jgi:succinyl-diaminopimelate desuccinylase
VSRLDATLELVAIHSVSGAESDIAHFVAQQLRSNPHLEVERVGDNVVARTNGHFSRRVIVAGHLDTVPGDSTLATKSKDRVTGLGASDMKGSLAVMLELAQKDVTWGSEITWVFYAREEIARSESGLLELATLRPDLLQGDVAILGEPTGGVVEVGCQGTLRLLVTLRGERAHVARAFAGVNALHRLGHLLSKVATYVPRSVDIDGVVFTEQLQAVFAEGGVAANVVPDRAQCTLNHRVAPDRNKDQAVASVLEFLGDVLGEGDEVSVLDWAPPAPPTLNDAVIAHLVALTGEKPRAKVGWTDVATFYERGVPATNFGAGDPLLAHRSDEFVTESELDTFANVLESVLKGI